MVGSQPSLDSVGISMGSFSQSSRQMWSSNGTGMASASVLPKSELPWLHRARKVPLYHLMQSPRHRMSDSGIPTNFVQTHFKGALVSYLDFNQYSRSREWVWPVPS